MAAEVAKRYYTVETCANDKGFIYYQRVQEIEDGVAETIAYWSPGRRVPAGTELKQREFRTIAEALGTTMSMSGVRHVLHMKVARILRKWEANQR